MVLNLPNVAATFNTVSVEVTPTTKIIFVVTS